MLEESIEKEKEILSALSYRQLCLLWWLSGNPLCQTLGVQTNNLTRIFYPKRWGLFTEITLLSALVPELQTMKFLHGGHLRIQYGRHW